MKVQAAFGLFFALVKTAVQVELFAFLNEDEADGGQGQGDEHTDKAEQLAERHQREDDPKRRQADAVADNFWGDEETF